MPLYEYQCNTCGEEFEKMVRFSEAELTPACPACQGEDTRKKISAFASLAAFLTAGRLFLRVTNSPAVCRFSF
jgi:putative FmdB family regulatory protein